MLFASNLNTHLFLEQKVSDLREREREGCSMTSEKEEAGTNSTCTVEYLWHKKEKKKKKKNRV